MESKMTAALWETDLGPDSADNTNENDSILPNLLEGLQIEARPYQLRIASQAIQMFRGEFENRHGETEAAANSVMIESPTGSGKTVMGLTVARMMQREFGYKIGWVAMRRNLLAQAEEENRRRGFNVEMELISMFDKKPPNVDMLIVDEAQHDAAMSMANLHSSVKPKSILGLTATPFRTDRVKLCFDKVITDVGIHQLIQDGYLSRFHHYTIPEYSPKAVANCYADDVPRWGKSLIFFHRLEQCIECRDVLLSRGIQVDLVTAKTDRQRQLADFHEGKTDVLINMAILTEGFDCPELKTVFCRPSSKSCTIQMAGRVFRKHEESPFKQVVQCKKTQHPIMKTAMPDEQYIWMDHQWRSLKLNSRIAEISLASRRLIANANVELPTLVAQNRTRNQHPWQRDENAED